MTVRDPRLYGLTSNVARQWTPTLAMELDPKLQPGAYITDWQNLYEVVAIDGGTVTLQNATTETRIQLPIEVVLRTSKLAKRAPKAPDTPATINEE